MVIRPVLLRPPWLCRPSVRALTGRPFHSSERSIRTSPRWPGVVGLYDLSAMITVFRLLQDRLVRGIGRRSSPVEPGSGSSSKIRFRGKTRRPRSAGAARFARLLSEAGRNVDGVSLFEGHIGLLLVAA